MPVCLRSQPSCHASLKFAGYSNLLNGDILKMSNLKLPQPGVFDVNISIFCDNSSTLSWSSFYASLVLNWFLGKLYHFLIRPGSDVEKTMTFPKVVPSHYEIELYHKHTLTSR